VSEGPFRTVATYREAIQAETAAELLRSAGIEAVVSDANTASVQPLYSFALGGVKVWVREPDLPRARTLLRDLLINLEYGLRVGARPRAAGGAMRCRGCGSPATVAAPGLGGLLSLGIRRRCLACGHVGWRMPRWRDVPEAPLPPAFERAIAEYEAGLRGRLLGALRRALAAKHREAARATVEAAAERRRRTLDARYEAVRREVVAAVAQGLRSEAERDLLAAQEYLTWRELAALERRRDALTGPGRRVLERLTAEARRRAGLAE